MVFQDFPRPTKGYHTKGYASISPSRPELSLKGKSVLITGGATGIGIEITKAFATAGASNIALLARSEKPMLELKGTIESEYPNTKIQIFAASVTDQERVKSIIQGLGTLDVIVLNAATMPKMTAALDTDPRKLLETFEVNVVGPLNLMSAFVALPPRETGDERTIIYTSSAGIHLPLTGTAGYNATKAAGTNLIQNVAKEYGAQGIRAFAFHPAIAFTPLARDVMGFKEDQFPYDSPEIAGHYAVWLCSPEADFLKGRFTWSHWNVDELKAKRALIESDPAQLSIGLIQDKVVEA